MKNASTRPILMLIILLLAPALSYSQCELRVHCYPSQVFPGEKVLVSASGRCGVIMQSYFDGGVAGPDWFYVQNPVDFSNPCGSGPFLTYLWISKNPTPVRMLETDSLNLSKGNCYIRWRMRYGLDSAVGDCNAPDYTDEGVRLQYSTDAGAIWNDFPGPSVEPVGDTTSSGQHYTKQYGTGTYWAPHTNQQARENSGLYRWNYYQVAVPPQASVNGTRVRWIQQNADGYGNDTWGIDEVEIECPPVSNNIVWSFGSTVLNPPAIVVEDRGVVSYDTCFVATIYEGGYSATDSCCVTVRSAMGMNKDSHNENTHIYPNPSCGAVNIELPYFYEEIVTVEVLNSTGAQIYMNDFQKTEMISIDLTANPSGIYYLLIATADYTVMKKLVLE